MNYEERPEPNWRALTQALEDGLGSEKTSPSLIDGLLQQVINELRQQFINAGGALTPLDIPNVLRKVFRESPALTEQDREFFQQNPFFSEMIEQQVLERLLLPAAGSLPELAKLVHALTELDKTARDMVKVTPPAVSAPADADTTMSIEGGREPQDKGQKLPEEQVKERTRKELAQRFTYKDEKEISPGVNPLQLDFLRDAARVGAFEWVKEYTAEMVVDYFTTDVTYVDIAQKYGLTKQAVQERITRGMSKMRRVLYKNNPEIAQEDPYPLEQIQKGKNEKDIFKTEKHKQKRGQAIRAGLRRPSPETRRKPSTDIFVPKQELP